MTDTHTIKLLYIVRWTEFCAFGGDVDTYVCVLDYCKNFVGHCKDDGGHSGVVGHCKYWVWFPNIYFCQIINPCIKTKILKPDVQYKPLKYSCEKSDRVRSYSKMS